MLFANVCAGFISSCNGECSFRRFLGFSASSWCLVCMGVLASLIPCCAQDLGCKGVPLTKPAPRAKVGVGIIFVTSGENAWQLVKLPSSMLGLRVVSGKIGHIC